MADIILFIILLLCICLVWIILYDLNTFKVRELVIRDPRIRKPVCFAMISDLHNNRFGKDNCLLIEAIQDMNPDMIIIAGDVFNAVRKNDPTPAVKFCDTISQHFPVFLGNGNHEKRITLYPEKYVGVGDVFEAGIAKTAVKRLINSAVTLEEYGIKLFGLDIDHEYYVRGERPDMPADYIEGLLGQPDESLYNILIAHDPEYFPVYSKWGADLSLSGHYHGGIARIPFTRKGVISPRLELFPQYSGGEYIEGGRRMLLSRGLGVHTIPIKVFNPGELWKVILLPEGD